MKVTFVVHGGEVLAIFRAVQDAESGKWIREKPYLGRCTGRWYLNCYAHVGQHGECDPALLKCRRATYEEYAPLLAEMRDIVGYDVETVQHGRLKLREETGYAACWLDEHDNNNYGCYRVFTGDGARGRALDWLTDYIFERAKLLDVDVADQSAKPVLEDGCWTFPKMTWQQVRDQLGSGMDFGLVLKADWEYGYLTVKEQAVMGIREVTIA